MRNPIPLITAAFGALLLSQRQGASGGQATGQGAGTGSRWSLFDDLFTDPLSGDWGNGHGVSMPNESEAFAGYNGWLPADPTARQRIAPYANILASLERIEGLPAGLLVRVAWQESRFRTDIISGETRSRVGAIGMFQIMPATAADPGYGVAPIDDPTDWYESARFAAAYLNAMRARTNSWSEALAAYNWGLGNVQRKGLASAPAETREYYASITTDTGIA